jgi:hypothetical protein
MGKKTITEKQHFVPQFYLKTFSNDENELHIYDAKEFRVMKNRGSRGVCHDSFFYAAETGKADEISQEIEDMLSKQIEEPLSKEIPGIVSKIEKNQQITDDDKYTLAMFMNTMWLRSPRMRNQINGMETQVLKWMNKIRYSHSSIDDELDRAAKELGKPISKEERDGIKEMMINEEYDIALSNKSHLRFMLDAEHLTGFTNLFYGQYWIVHISKCDRQFITSDNPITVVTPEKTGFYGASFLERTHIFPLTPHIAIEAIYPHNLSGKKIKRKTHPRGDEQAVDDINLRIAGQARYLYSSRSNEIDWFDNRANDIHELMSSNLKKMIKISQYSKQKPL